MNWNKLTNVNQIAEIKALSGELPVLIFKHSTRCSVSSMSLDRLLRNWKKGDETKLLPYYLDLITYRDVSDAIAKEFGIPHESPQVLLIKDGNAFYDSSHFDINYRDIMGRVGL